MSKLITSVCTWFVVNLIAFCALIIVHFANDFPKWWSDVFSVCTNLLTSGLVSFLIYFLVVHLPAHRKKSIVKTNLLKVYRSIKEGILWEVVQASKKGGRSDLATSSETIEALMSPEGFKTAFKDGREADEGFYAFTNQMKYDTPEFQRIVLNLKMLSQQIEFLLHNYSIDDQETFDFFKRLELLLIDLQAHGPGYDEAGPLCRFIYELYAGWNFIDGYIGHDWLEKKISNL